MFTVESIKVTVAESGILAGDVDGETNGEDSVDAYADILHFHLASEYPDAKIEVKIERQLDSVMRPYSVVISPDITVLNDPDISDLNAYYSFEQDTLERIQSIDEMTYEDGDFWR